MPTSQQAVQQLGAGVVGCTAPTGGGAAGVVAWALAHLGIPYQWGGCLAGVPSCGSAQQLRQDGFLRLLQRGVVVRRAGSDPPYGRRAVARRDAGARRPGATWGPIFSEFAADGPHHVMIVVTPGNPGVAAEEPRTGDVSKTISYTGGGVSFGRPR